MISSLRHRHEKGIDRGRTVGILDDHAEERPLCVIAGAGERPGAIEPEPSGHGDGLAGRHERRGGERLGRLAPDLDLGFLGIGRERDRMGSQHGIDPGGRAAGAREHFDDVDEIDQLRLVAAETLRLERAQEPRFVQLGDRRFGHAAAQLGFARARLEARQEFARPRQELVARQAAPAPFDRRGRLGAQSLPSFTSFRTSLRSRNTVSGTPLSNSATILSGSKLPSDISPKPLRNCWVSL